MGSDNFPINEIGEFMKCWHCNSEVIWGGDHDYEDYGLEGDGIVSNLSCSECKATYIGYLPIEKKE